MPPDNVPTVWSLFQEQLKRIEDKVDLLRDQAVGKSEFLRALEAQKEINASLESSVRTLADKVSSQETEKLKEQAKAIEKEQDEKARHQIFWAGMVLSPIAAAVVAWFVNGGLNAGA